MAGKESPVITRRERRSVDEAVRAAEQKTGLQFCVYLGPAQEDARVHAESLFVESGLHERPAVLLLVAPDRRRVELVTAPAVQDRLSDEACALVIDVMTPLFAEGRYVEGLIRGLGKLAEEAGPGTGVASGADLPNVLDE